MEKKTKTKEKQRLLKLAKSTVRQLTLDELSVVAGAGGWDMFSPAERGTNSNY